MRMRQIGSARATATIPTTGSTGDYVVLSSLDPSGAGRPPDYIYIGGSGNIAAKQAVTIAGAIELQDETVTNLAVGNAMYAPYAVRCAADGTTATGLKACWADGKGMTLGSMTNEFNATPGADGFATATADTATGTMPVIAWNPTTGEVRMGGADPAFVSTPVSDVSRIIGWWCSEDLDPGAVASWPSRIRRATATATQGTVGNQPTVATTPGVGFPRKPRLQAVKSSAQYLIAPSTVYGQLSGPSNYVSYSIIARCRPTTWDGNVMGMLTATVGYHQHLANANPAWKYSGPALTELLSDLTDVSQTTRYVVFAYDSDANKFRIYERGMKSEADTIVRPAETCAELQLLAAGAGLNAWGGSVDEIALVTGAVVDADMPGILRHLFRDQKFQLLCVGNSIAAGYAGAMPFLSILEDQLPMGYGLTAAYARGAAQTAALTAACALNDRLKNQVIPGVSRVFFWEATNSIINGVSFADLKSQHAAFKALCDSIGVEVFGATCLPRTTITAGLETIRSQWNAELIANPTAYVTSSAHVVRLDQIVAMQNPASTTYYTDGTHPTTLGNTYIADAILQAVLNVTGAA